MNDLDFVIPMYNLIEYNNNYEQKSGSLWHYHKDDLNDNMADSESFKFTSRLTNNTKNEDPANV